MNHRKSVTILVADDDEEDRMFFRDAFEENNLTHHDLRFVEDGQELMNYLLQVEQYSAQVSSPRPGIIVLDLNMPRKDGRESLSEIKAHPVLRSIPVIVMTTSGADNDILSTYNLGVNSFIKKPITANALTDIVRVIGEYWLKAVQLPIKA